MNNQNITERSINHLEESIKQKKLKLFKISKHQKEILEKIEKLKKENERIQETIQKERENLKFLETTYLKDKEELGSKEIQKPNERNSQYTFKSNFKNFIIQNYQEDNWELVEDFVLSENYSSENEILDSLPKSLRK